jgi:hypothetical protein
MALSCACRGLSLGKCVSPFQGRSPRNPAVAQGVAPQGVAPGRCPPQGVAPGRCPPRALPQAVAPPRALRQGVAPPGRCARALPPQGVAPGRCPPRALRQGVAPPGRCLPRALPWADMFRPYGAIMRKPCAGWSVGTVPYFAPQGPNKSAQGNALGALGRWGAGALGRWGAGALGRWGAGGAILPRRGRTNQPRATPWGRWGRWGPGSAGPHYSVFKYSRSCPRATSLRLAPNSWPILELPTIGVPSGLLTL